MPRRAALAALPVALLACAGPLHRLQRAELPPVAPAPARAEFLPADGDEIFARAVGVADLEGYPLRTCDAGRARMETKPFELLQAACGATTCLARQTVEVKLGHHAARVTVTREIYDAPARTWRLDGEGSAEAARELLGRIMSLPRLDLHRNPCTAAVRVQVSALGAGGARP